MTRVAWWMVFGLVLSACATPPEEDNGGEQLPVTQTSVTTRPLWQGVSTPQLVAGCFGCHGPEGRSGESAIPSLAGLPEAYFIRVMQAYQYGGRYGTLMERIALGYQPEEIVRMARYFSRLKHEPRAQRISWQQVSLGRRLHRQYCMECHGDLEQAPSEEANRLNGQWMDYLYWTLEDYLIGINQSDAGMSKQLKNLIRRHGEKGLDALINYYGSARP